MREVGISQKVAFAKQVRKCVHNVQHSLVSMY
jgi:hypothetical protein